MNGTLLLLLFCFLVFCAALLTTMKGDTDAAGPASAGKRESIFSRLGSRIADIFTPDEPVIILEEEVEIMVDIPRGVDMGCRSNSSLVRAPAIIRKPIIILEEEVEITRDIPEGTSFDTLSNSKLDPSRWPGGWDARGER